MKTLFQVNAEVRKPDAPTTSDPLGGMSTLVQAETILEAIAAVMGGAPADQSYTVVSVQKLPLGLFVPVPQLRLVGGV